MKYRQLTPQEIETYRIGYKVGKQEMLITDIEWESESEHKIYRKGYLAGCKDRQRKMSTTEQCPQCQQCQQCQNHDSYIDIDIDIDKRDNKGGVGEKEEKKTDQKLSTDVIHMLGNSYKAVDAVIVAGKTPTGKTYEGIQIKNKRLLEFVKKRFNKNIMQKASDWAIDHQQHGYTYNASRLLKLLCKFQRDYEPAINYTFVQAEYIGFEPETNRSTPVKTA